MRYLGLKDFIRYCKKLNVDINENELEFYEREGYLFPVARRILPAEYVQIINKLRYAYPALPEREKQTYLNQLDIYEHALRLEEKLPYDGMYTDEQIMPLIDREIDKNPHLVRPSQETYLSWKTYRISVIRFGEPVRDSVAMAYYHAWQVHQVYQLQQYPDVYKNRLLLKHVDPSYLNQSFHPWVPNKEYIRTMDDKIHGWDAVSLFAMLYRNERTRIFAPIPEHHGVKTLDEQQHQLFIERIKVHAFDIMHRYTLSVDQLYEFLYSLVDMKSDYEKLERLKLANSLLDMIHDCARLVYEITGKEWEGIAEELKTKGYPFWTVNDFRHINRGLKDFDGAKEVLSFYLEKHPLTFDSHKVTETDIDNILWFCEKHNLSILIFSLADMMATEDERWKFRRSTRYTTLKNLSTSLEYYLKALATNAQSKGLVIYEAHSTWMVLIKVLFIKEQKWFSAFKNKQLHDPLTLTDLQARLTQIQTVKSETARHFLVATIARNITVHTYPTDGWFYGDVSGELSFSIMYVLFYSWYVAKRDGWV